MDGLSLEFVFLGTRPPITNHSPFAGSFSRFPRSKPRLYSITIDGDERDVRDSCAPLAVGNPPIVFAVRGILGVGHHVNHSYTIPLRRSIVRRPSMTTGIRMASNSPLRVVSSVQSVTMSGDCLGQYRGGGADALMQHNRVSSLVSVGSKHASNVWKRVVPTGVPSFPNIYINPRQQ